MTQNSTEFFMAMIPPTTTFQNKKITIKNNKAMIYSSAELKAARAKLMAHLGQHVPDKRYTGAVRVMVKWCFPISAKHQDGEYKSTRPDIDNSQKLLFDCMTDLGFWKDDALIVSLIAEKFWAKMPGIYIRIEEI